MTAATRTERGLLLRWGLPRDPAATSHLAGFLVTTVATVLLTRGLLAATGYPQVGGDGLHVAHVLWGGLAMALGFVVLLSFAGPVARPVGALVGGVGFGLFVDEVGKFVTDDNDYFYEPTAALIYLVVVALLLLADMLHGRRPHHPAEYLAGAADHAVAGLAGGFTTDARDEAHRLLGRAGDVRGAPQVRALLDEVEHDTAELPNPIDGVWRWTVRAAHRLITVPGVTRGTVVVLMIVEAVAVWRGVNAWIGGADVPLWIVVGLVLSAGASGLVALAGMRYLRRQRVRAFTLFRRALLVNLLVTQVFLFRLEEWAATTGLLVDLLVLGLIAAELSHLRERGARVSAEG